MAREHPFRVMRTVELNHRLFRLLNGDMCYVQADAIVNAANESLAHGGGVAAQIVKNGGRIIQEESDLSVRENGPVPTGTARSTGAGKLPAKRVIHAVGPRWGEGDEAKKLRRAVLAALNVAKEENLQSIVFPAISTGIFGFPKERAAEAIFPAIKNYFSRHESGIKLVRAVLLDETTIHAFLEVWEKDEGS